MSHDRVFKFGGSSLASAANYRDVAALVCQSEVKWVVVSAAGDTTDLLLALAELSIQANSPQQTQSQDFLISQLISYQRGLLLFLPEHVQYNLIEQIQLDVCDVILKEGVTLDEVVALGEHWSSRILSAYLQARGNTARALDARDFFRQENGQFDAGTSRTLIKPYLGFAGYSVVTGYIARDHAGQTVTFGRNGSDYTATLLADIIDAKDVVLWTDVDGIYAADPRKVHNDRLTEVSTHQLSLLARLGNPIIHLKTLQPMLQSDLTLHVRQTDLGFQSQGTRVNRHAQQQWLLTNTNLRRHLVLQDVNQREKETILNAFTSSPAVLVDDHERIELLVEEDDYARLKPFLDTVFTQRVKDEGQAALIGVVRGKDSENQVFDALSTVLHAQAIQSETKVLKEIATDDQYIWLLDAPCEPETLIALFGCLPSQKESIALVVAGIGQVGQTFLQQLSALQANWPNHSLQLVGICNSKQAIFDKSGLLIPSALSDFQQYAQSYQPSDLVEFCHAVQSKHLVFFDLTASQDLPTLYPQLVEAGCHLIGANKHGKTQPIDLEQTLQECLSNEGRVYLSNTTVGAGLPVQHTIQELTETGDRITQIQGIFSGTLSWLLCQFDGQRRFSELVQEAQSLGYTEPDPREDISGGDVQRKLLILAREAGVPLNISDIEIDPLLPSQFLNPEVTLASQWDDIDAWILSLYQRANRQKCCLRYVGSLRVLKDGYQANVRLEMVSRDSDLAAIRPCDNVFQIQSERYAENPIVIRGPGAGNDVTAAGVIADLKRLCHQI
ncbi:bifunctional aspartate kinase/homoserine dehydrogenase II [Algicola sagamiensis]|uniref:bifunctional aspartate kinase/homoserine dehydrogenase II n=1 Tax=Algicola sagamiensis TaxID=163869 RepID=UPI00035EB518|nr:bifunctional aspartate kinase/homoserine dehydrogenase II [Algicola sagamiensis]